MMVQAAPKAELELKVRPRRQDVVGSAADFTAGYHSIPVACPAPGVSHLNQESGHLQAQAGEQHRMPGSDVYLPAGQGRWKGCLTGIGQPCPVHAPIAETK